MFKMDEWMITFGWKRLIKMNEEENKKTKNKFYKHDYGSINRRFLIYEVNKKMLLKIIFIFIKLI